MRTFTRHNVSKAMILLLCFVLTFGILLTATSPSYAAETDVVEETVESGTPDLVTEPSDDGEDIDIPDNGTVEEDEEEDTSDHSDAIEAPKNLTVKNVTSTSVTLEWDFRDDVYEIDVWNADTDEWLKNINNWNLIVGDLKPETTYRVYITWWERPAPVPDLRVKSNIVEFTTLKANPDDPEPPTLLAPQNLQATSTSRTVTLTWDPVENATGYDVYTGGGQWVKYVDGPMHTIVNLKPSTEYTYYVRAQNSVFSPIAQSPPSEKIHITTKEPNPDEEEPVPDRPLAPPSYLKVTDVKESSVTLGWTGISGNVGYPIYVNDEYKGEVWDGSNSYTFLVPEGTERGTVFRFMASSFDGEEESAYSNIVTLIWGDLAAPKDLQAVTTTRSTVAFGWAPTPGATSYDVYQNGVPIGVTNTNRYVSTGLTEGQSYSFKVIARNSLWTSPESEEVTVVPGSNFNIVTYFTSWLPYDRADLTKITHINYAFSDLCWGGYGTGDTKCQNDEIPLQKDYVFDGEMVIGDPKVDVANLNGLAQQRDQNSHLKLLISVGGWSWSKNFSNMAATEETRLGFANSVVKFLREYRLDGLDIDWEYPVEGGESHNSHRPEDKENFTLLMRTVRDALDAAGSEDGKYYLLSIASAQGDNFVVNADLANSSHYLDFINIMTYDYSGSWELLAHHNSPLYYDKNHPNATAPRNNVQGGVMGHLNGGVADYKLHVGVPFYGKSWADCPPNGQYQTCGAGGPSYNFSDLENKYVDKNGYKRYWNEAAKAAYLYNDDKKIFITYNDRNSMAYIASMVKSLDLAGVMSWEISGDSNNTLSTQLVQDLPIDGRVDSSALKAPDQLAAVSRNTRSIQIEWDETERATGYEVFINGQWAGNTSETRYTADGLTPNTAYRFHVLAIDRDGDDINRVSPASQSLSVSTLSETVTPPVDPPVDPPVSPPSSGGSSSSPSPSPQQPKATDQLEFTITKDGDKSIVRIKKDAAVRAIKNSTFTKFRVPVQGNVTKAEVNIPKEVLAAIADKGENAELSIIVNGSEYTIPLRALPLSSDVKITIESPERDVIDSMIKQLQAAGLKLVAGPLEFKIEKLNADQTAEEITDFNRVYISRIFSFRPEGVDVNQSTGIVFNPDKNTIWPVPTVFTLNSDGTVTAELKRSGNSLYAVVESSISFEDVTQGWALKDVSLAAAKLIVSGKDEGIFGMNEKMTRGEFISMIVKALGIIPESSDISFKDVDAKSDYAREIAAAKSAGIITGGTDGTINPDGFITRQDMAVMLANAMKYAGNRHAANPAVLNRFDDRSAISAYAKDALALMVKQRIMVGVSPTRLDPGSHATKAQATVAVMRMLRAMNLSN